MPVTASLGELVVLNCQQYPQRGPFARLPAAGLARIAACAGRDSRRIQTSTTPALLRCVFAEEA